MPPKDSPFQTRFNAALEAALARGRTQEQIREEIGCSKNMIRHWKAGEHLPQHHHAKAISRVLGIPVEEMFEEKGEAPAATGDPEASDTTTSLLERLTELELDRALQGVEDARSSLQQLEGVLPDLLDLLAEARRHVHRGG